MKNVLRRRDRMELSKRIGSLSPEAAAHWGRMNVGQMVSHLCDNFRVSLGERTATPVGNVFSRTLIKSLMLYTPLAMPKGTISTQELDQERGGTAPGAFLDDLNTLEALLDRFARETEGTANEHPFFGRLSRSQWGRFHYKHMDHHLRQFGA